MPDGDIKLNSGNFDKLRDVIHKNTGITVADNRKSLIETRLRSRLREIEETSFSEYLGRLSTDSDEMQELINRVTTNETYCYRTPLIWDFFTEEFIPAFCNKKSGSPMRAWSAAASTGEEAHTIGIFSEGIRQKTPEFDYQILGTDISSRVIEKAKKGLYVGRAIARLEREQPDLFARHMSGDAETGFSVKPAIKRRISFKLHNLIKPLPQEASFDIVFLRNVLIYFSAAEQERILDNVARKLNPDGVLIIGESESLTRLNTVFRQDAPLIYRMDRM